MLIKKSKFDVGDILSLKIVNGDELVGKLEEETEDAYIIDRPCTVIPSQQGIGLLQSLMTAEPNSVISISKQHVIMAAPTIDSMNKHYIQTTTGIQPVTKGSIIT